MGYMWISVQEHHVMSVMGDRKAMTATDIRNGVSMALPMTPGAPIS